MVYQECFCFFAFKVIGFYSIVFPNKAAGLRLFSGCGHSKLTLDRLFISREPEERLKIKTLST